MTPNANLRPAGIGFVCCGLGMLTAAVVARQPVLLPTALPLLGLGIMFFAKSRQAD